MNNKCPKCGSVRIIKANEDVNICLACESFLNMINGKNKPSLFDYITTSPEALAEKFVFSRGERCWRRRRCETVFYEVWWSALTGEEYKSKAEALSATIEKLKEAYDG